MLNRIRSTFSAKLILLIGLVFIIPVATSLITLVLTSNASLDRFDLMLENPELHKDGLIREIFPQGIQGEIKDPDSVMRLLKSYEERRSFALFMSLIVISVALAGVVVLLSMLILKRGMLSLHELSIAAAEIGEGNFNIQLEERSRDEFARLISAFKLMAKNLKETTVSRDFYNHAIESMPAAVFTADNDGHVTTWNLKASELTGLSAKETVGKRLSQFADVIGKPIEKREIPFFGREGVIKPRGKRQCMVSRGVDHLYDRKGEMAGLIETFVDVTAQKELERELIIAKEKAEESSRLRSEFLANMSHEIRTPLNGILGLAELLAEEEKDAGRREHLETIKNCGENLLHMINEILELSKLEAGRLVLHPAVVATADIISEASDTIEVGCRKKGIELEVKIDEGTPAIIEVDNRKLAQVIINLLGNALKFTQKGFIRLKVAPYHGDRRGDLLIEVADSGIGIMPERQEYIFESFVQAEGYLTKASDGTGLGLAIARRLVGLMGGDIWVESEHGRGSIFSFTIDTKHST